MYIRYFHAKYWGFQIIYDVIAICSSFLKYEIIDLNKKHDCKYILGNRKY